MLYIFEMANNHMGSVHHAKGLLMSLPIWLKRKELMRNQMQFRNLSTFIHPDFQQRNDLKYVKRFNETRLSKEQQRDRKLYETKGLLHNHTF